MPVDRPLGALVQAQQVTKSFRLGPESTLRAVDSVTLSVDPGSLVALTGPSGSGKSTLLHLLGAIETPDEGRIRIDDVDLGQLRGRALARYRRSVGFVFQRYNLLPALTALDNVTAPLLPYATSFDKRDRARQLLAAVGLRGREGSLPSRMSGGQQQRVAIARAFINSPRLLLADEPTGNLDSRTGEEILELLFQSRSERGMTVVVATHDPMIATRCDRMLRLHDGAIVDDIDLTDRARAEQVIEQWRQPPQISPLP